MKIQLEFTYHKIGFGVAVTGGSAHTPTDGWCVWCGWGTCTCRKESETGQKMVAEIPDPDPDPDAVKNRPNPRKGKTLNFHHTWGFLVMSFADSGFQVVNVGRKLKADSRVENNLG